MGPTWLKDAIFYEIYPQSFQDSNDDGIGDIPGIIDRLDYVARLQAGRASLRDQRGPRAAV